jgi:hypothetical protein
MRGFGEGAALAIGVAAGDAEGDDGAPVAVAVDGGRGAEAEVRRAAGAQHERDDGKTHKQCYAVREIT